MKLTASQFALALALALSALSAAPIHAQLLPGRPAAGPTETELELAQVQSVAQLLQRADEYRKASDWRRYTYVMQRILQLRPYATPMQYELARGYALQGDKSGTYDTLIKLQEQGMKYDPSKDPDFAKVRETPAYEYIVKGLQANATPFGSGKATFTIASDLELIESLAHDRKTNTFYAGSIKSGAVLKIERSNGKTSEWLQADADAQHWGVFSMAADATRRRLWLGTSAVAMFDGYLAQEHFGRASLVEVDLDSGKRLRSYSIPFNGKPHVPAALALGPNGEVYATDAITPTIYQLRDGKVIPLFASPALTGLRGLAVSPDHKNVYFSDYETGLYGADLGRNQVFQLTSPKQNLGGIDGVYWAGNQLLALQTATNPQRIMRVLLDPKNSRAVTQVAPLEANKPEFKLPSSGVVVGTEIYFISNSQLDLYGVDGKILAGEKAVRREVFAARTDQPLPEPKAALPQLPARK